MTDNILEIERLTKTYPGVIALNNVSVSFRRGEVHAIVGENGAGKSTLIKAVTGALTPDSGIIGFEGTEYTHLTPWLSSHIGIGAVYQELNLIPPMTVAENVFLGNLKGNGVTVNYKAMNEETMKVMSRLGVAIPPEERIENLTVGHRQIVEIACSLVKNLKLLIMDEPSAPLTKNEVKQMYDIVKTLKAEGITILYISHRLEEIFDIADRVTVLRDGAYVTTLDVTNTNMRQLIKYMVGRALRDDYPPRTSPIGEEILRVENLTGNGVQDINFVLHKGEILGFAGLLGCGRTETMQLIFGVRKKKSGRIFIKGKEVNIRNTAHAFRLGIGLIPEDRKLQGAFLPMTIKWNNAISCLRKKLMKGIIVDTKKERSLAQEYVNKLQTRTPSVEQLVQNLSGGNQQKVVVSKVLATDADIMIFDEPTRGIDVGAKQEMYKLVRNLADQGKSILFVSSEMGEVIGLSDRMVVLCEGRQMGTLKREQFSQETILTLASGLKIN